MSSESARYRKDEPQRFFFPIYNAGRASVATYDVILYVSEYDIVESLSAMDICDYMTGIAGI